MQASETRFQPIIEGTKQYLIPLFQRAYSWKKENWAVLWDDLVWLCENAEPKIHFIGSIVTMPTVTVPQGVTKYLLIDGQQRLTTLFILLSLIRDKAQEEGIEQIAQETHQTMIVNYFQQGLDHFKLLPTQADRQAFQAIVKKQELDESSKITECYRFFERKIKNEPVDLATLLGVIKTRLSIVGITLDFDDNPYLVFESLNAKGLPLTQADLIRNFFFMRIHFNEQEEVYDQYWRPMQEALGDNLTEYIRHFLMRNGSLVKQTDVYYTLKERVGQTDAIEYLKEIYRFSRYYQKILYPQYEQNTGLRELLIKLNRLEVTTAYPFLLNCYDDYQQGRLSAEDFKTILLYIENYLIRRFVCNYPSNQLNKIFPLLYDQASLAFPHDLKEGVRNILQQRGYPKDLEFRARLIESKLYGAGDRRTKTKVLLENLEESFGHKEQTVFDNLTIEHLMPQTLTEWWQDELGEDYLTTHELWLHTLGNLTLTAYNSELSNADFPTKKNLLSQSHLDLNKYFTNLQTWNREEIEKRSNLLAEKILEIWSYFGDAQGATGDSTSVTDEVTGKTPYSLKILGQTYSVTSWRDVLLNTLNAISEVEPEAFYALSTEYPRFISATDTGFRSSRTLSNGYFVEVNLSAKSIHRFCLQVIESVGLTKDDWIVETNNQN